jgi:hypothetical protein
LYLINPLLTIGKEENVALPKKLTDFDEEEYSA